MPVGRPPPQRRSSLDRLEASLAVAALPEGTRLGNYRVVHAISSGGFSLVYLAQDERSGERVAIKEYLPSSLAERPAGTLVPLVAPERLPFFRFGLTCFFEEARTLSTIRHENIVHVIDFLRAHETVYMVMRFVEGRSLQEHIKRSREPGRTDVLSEAFIRRVFIEILTGLREVHNHRILHLDLKPANIFLRMNGAPILLDFGAARQTLQRDMSKNHPMYTPGFAAPELYRRDAELGPWTDVYGIGACLFTCMAGKALPESTDRLKSDIVPMELRAFRGLYSSEMLSIVRSCLALNSLERPASALDLQRLLQKPIVEAPRRNAVSRFIAQCGQLQLRVARFLQERDIHWF
jgi:serine/threonine protein kinase